MLDILATGYPSFDSILPVSHTPKVGETALIQSIPDQSHLPFGGCGANVAVGLAHLGFNCGVAMILGDDPPGKSYKKHLSKEGIDQSNIITMQGEQTSRSYLFCAPDGEHQNFFYPGAADAWRGELELKNLDNVRYGLVTVGPFFYNQQFVTKMASAGIPLIWQMKPDVMAYPEESIPLFLEASDVVLMNHIEAEFVCKAQGVTSPAKLLKGNTHVILITQGASGVSLYTTDVQAHIPSVQMPVTDVTGAGDGFAAGFIAGMLRGFDIVVAAQMGIIVASFVIEKFGCQTNLPTWDQMQKRYERYFKRL